VVRWIGGGEERFYDLNINRRYDVIEGEGLQSAPNDPGEGGLPLVFGLTDVFPNPFNSTTTIGFALPEAGEITLQIVDLQGRVVETLMTGQLTSGHILQSGMQHKLQLVCI